MQAFYSHCIFCREELPPPDKRGVGEHIIPEFIYGSVKIKDVCRRCNSKLGTEVDHKILEDPRIIGAIMELDITELKDKIIEKGTTTGKDTLDGHEVKYNYKKGQFTQNSLQALTPSKREFFSRFEGVITYTPRFPY